MLRTRPLWASRQLLLRGQGTDPYGDESDVARGDGDVGDGAAQGGDTADTARHEIGRRPSGWTDHGVAGIIEQVDSLEAAL